MRIDFIDGLRGFFALGVVYFHYSALFYPTTPWGFYNSASIVCGFFVISGFVLSYRFWQNRETKFLTSAALRRYVRLTPAPLVAILLACLFLKLDLLVRTDQTVVLLFHHINEYTQTPSFFDAIKEGLWGMYFAFDKATSYDGVLWTMEYELKGSLMSLACLALLGNVKKRFLLYVVFLLLTFDSLYLNFVLGIMLSDLMYSDEGKKYFEMLKSKNILSWMLFLVGSFLSYYALDICSFYAWNENLNLYEKINFEIFKTLNVDVEVFYHSIGIFMLIYSVIQLNFLQKIFNAKFFTTLGQYSYSIYLVHLPIATSFGGIVFFKCFQAGYSLGVSIFFASICGILITGIATFFLHNYVDIPAGKLAKRFEKIFY